MSIIQRLSSAQNRTSILPTVLVIALLMAACGPSTESAEATKEPDEDTPQTLASVELDSSPSGESSSERAGTLKLLYWQAPTIVNPHLSSGTKDLSASRITYEPLASFDSEGNMVPFLAAEIPSLDNGGVASDASYVIWKLKEGIMWADGEPFSADDVLFTYEYVTNLEVGSTSAATYADIESVEVLDDTTVKINFRKSNPSWFLPFVGAQGMIIPRHIFEDYNGANFSDASANLIAVGTGPYYVTEYVEEDILIIGTNAVSTNRIVYEDNPYYRDPDKPFFQKVELQGGGDIEVALEATKNGLVDFAWNLQLGDEEVADMESAGNATAVYLFGAWVERIMINFSDPNRETSDGERSSAENSHPFFSDKVVRQAVALAIDREAIVAAYGRGGRLTHNILVSPLSYYSPNTAVEYDPVKAAQLLDDAGWIDTDNDGVRDKDGIKLSLIFQTSISSLRQLTQAQVKEDLEAIGFEVELHQIDSSIFFGPPENTTDTRRQFYADLEEFAFSNKSPDPSAYMAAWTCDEIAQRDNDWSLSNWTRYCNVEYDALFEEARVELDPERRAELFIQLNDLLIEDAAVLPLVHLGDITGINVTLQGINLSPWDVEVWNIADWYRERE